MFCVSCFVFFTYDGIKTIVFTAVCIDSETKFPHTVLNVPRKYQNTIITF